MKTKNNALQLIFYKFIAGESRLSLPPSSSSPLPPPSPDGAPLSLPGLVSPGGPKSYDYLLKVLPNRFQSSAPVTFHAGALGG